MILQPGGAMALFVLRIAGLLSLEKSLNENSTDSSLNFTDNFPFYDVGNFTSVSALNASEPTFPNSSLFHVDNSSWTFLSAEKVKEDVGNGGKDIRQNVSISTTNDPQIIVNKERDVSNDSKDNFYDRKTLNETIITENYNQYENDTEDFTDIGSVYEDDVDVNSTQIYLNSTNEFKDQISSSSTILPPRNSDTGFSLVFSNQFSSTPDFSHSLEGTSPSSTVGVHAGKAPPWRNDTSNIHQREAIHPDFKVYGDGNFSSYYDTNLVSRSLISPVPQLGHEEGILEYLDPQNKTKNESVSTNNTFEETEEDEHLHLTDEEDEWTETGSQLMNINESDWNGNESSWKELINSSVTPFGSKQARNATTLPKRNNPYPYGPRILPEHILKYNPSLKPKETPQVLGTLFPEQDFLYNYDDVADHGQRKDGTRNKDRHKGEKASEIHPIDRFFVKTEKPTILFHFEKPGYSPKLPDSSLPPTRAPTPSDPWDCSPRCPKYTLLDWNQDYDIRQYPVTTWISTVIIAENRILAELEGYMRVQDYFYGLNDRGQLLNMTIPFVTQIKHGRHPGVLKEFKDFTISLYVNHIDDPLNYDLPTPISNEVLIDRLESKIIFVSGFEANVWEVTEAFLNDKASLLMDKLRENGEAFLDRYFYLASYSRPELYQPVYYELWIYATSFRDHVITTPPLAPRTRPPPNKITTKAINKLCRGVECPPFEVLRTYRYGIQKRRYFDGLFATTSPGVCEFSTLSVWKGFMPLHLYKHGINSHMEVIEATRPIGLVHVKEDSTSTTECPQNMTMAIYLPKRLHSNPPLTGYDAPAVDINALQDVVVYAYTVGGYLLEPNRVRKELSDLKYRLNEFGACFKKDEYYVVVYDFIMRYHGRQNEIWVVAENCKATLNG